MIDVQLRPLAAPDCPAVLSWFDSGDAVLQWSGPHDFSWPLTLETLVADLARVDEHRRLYAAISPTDRAVAGHAMLSIAPRHAAAVIGRVAVAPGQRGRGVGTALMRELVKVGFEELGLHRLELRVYDFNASAIACYTRAGFVIEGTLRDSVRASNGYWSTHIMAMLEGDYRRGCAELTGAAGAEPGGAAG